MTDPYYAAQVPAHVPAELVRDFNIYDFGGLDPFAAVHQLHQEGAPEIFWTRNNEGHWVLSRASAIVEIGGDPKHFSSNRHIVPDSQNFAEPTLLPLQLDPPIHSEFRKIVAPLMSPKRIAHLEERVRILSMDIIAEIKAGSGKFDFMKEYATVVPVGVFLEFLDLPAKDRPRLLQIANDIIKPPAGMHRDQPLQTLFDYLDPVIRERTAHPAGDVLSQILGSKINGAQLGFDDSVRLIASLILGGLDTIAASLGYLTRHLADTPTLRRDLIADSNLIPLAVDEALRRFPVAAPGRTVAEDCEVRGVAFRKGDHVIWTTGMFNFDEAIHTNPMQFDVHRKRAQHATFGVGIHFCIGNYLTKMEMRLFLETWLAAIPEFHVDPGAEVIDRLGITIAYETLPLIIGELPGDN